jgi:hypothetical protein
MYNAFQARTWSTTQGQIVDVGTYDVRHYRGGQSHCGYIWFKYVVHGHEYVHNDAWVEGDPCFGQQKDLDNLLAHYRPPMPATVYYDPDAPDHAVLFNTPTAGFWRRSAVTFAMAMGFAGVLLPLGFILFRQRREWNRWRVRRDLFR